MNNQTKHWTIIKALEYNMHQEIPLSPKGELRYEAQTNLKE
jgi:hypothetical protein